MANSKKKPQTWSLLDLLLVEKFIVVAKILATGPYVVLLVSSLLKQLIR